MVNSLMIPKAITSSKRFPTFTAFITFFSTVNSLMIPKNRFKNKKNKNKIKIKIPLGMSSYNENDMNH